MSCGGETQGNGSGSPPTQPGSIAITCGHVASCQAMDASTCERELTTQRGDALALGCGAAVDQVLNCDAQKPGACDVQSGGYAFSDTCQAAIEEVLDCERGDAATQECSLMTGSCPNPPCPMVCSVECPDFSAQCEQWPEETTARCSCTAGPSAGRSFTLAACGDVYVRGSRMHVTSLPGPRSYTAAT
jgi:hypothetical protein